MLKLTKVCIKVDTSWYKNSFQKLYILDHCLVNFHRVWDIYEISCLLRDLLIIRVFWYVQRFFLLLWKIEDSELCMSKLWKYAVALQRLRIILWWMYFSLSLTSKWQGGEINEIYLAMINRTPHWKLFTFHSSLQQSL